MICLRQATPIERYYVKPHKTQHGPCSCPHALCAPHAPHGALQMAADVCRHFWSCQGLPATEAHEKVQGGRSLVLATIPISNFRWCKLIMVLQLHVITGTQQPCRLPVLFYCNLTQSKL